jgi:hypothetical protein
MMKPSKQEQQMNPGDMQKLRQEVIRNAVVEPPIQDVPYIKVIFCKGHDGWMPFTAYGCDIDTKTTVGFINCINDATDVLNGKEGKK